MSHIFISYSHNDSEYAHQFADKAKLLSVSVWIDKKIKQGDLWENKLKKELAECAGLVLIMSSNSQQSDWVKWELDYALSNNKRIFPVLLEGKTWSTVKHIQHQDARNGNLPPSSFFAQLLYCVNPWFKDNVIQAPPNFELQKVLPEDWNKLDRIKKATDLLKFVSKADTYRPHPDDPIDESEAQLVDEFLAEVLSFIRVQMKGVVNAKTLYSLTKHLKLLKQKGVFVYAGIIKEKFTGDPKFPEKVNALHLVIRREEEDHILIRFSD